MADPTASISGLASGLDTAGIISQLMQVEAVTQTRLKSRVTDEQSTVTALQSLNSRLAALATKAKALAQGAGWSPLTTTSSLDTVTATANPGSTGATGSVTFTVDQVARAHTIRFTDTAGLTDRVTGTGTTVQLTTASGTTTIDTGDGTLQGLVTALNAGDTGVRASTLRLDDGSYRLRIEATGTGAASQFSLTAADGSDLLGGSAVTAQAADAAVTVDGDTLHSTTNTFTGLLAGVDVTLSAGAAPGSTATVTATRDTQAVTASVKDLVDTLNSLLDDLDTQTAYNSDTGSSGPLAGESAVRAVRDRIAEALYPTDGTSMAAVGLQLDRYGKFVLDTDKFAEAYAADPTAVSRMFTADNGGFADRVASVADAASDPYQGTVTTVINGHNSSIKRLQDSIADWDTRLALRKQTLTAQFTAMETALQQLQGQSSWLAGQIASLPTYSRKDS